MQTGVVHIAIQQPDGTPASDGDFSTAGIRSIMFVSLERNRTLLRTAIMISDDTTQQLNA